MSANDARNPAGPPGPPPEWQDPRWYPEGYQRDQLQIDWEKLREHPVLTWEGESYEDNERQNEPWRQLAGIILHAETLHRLSDRRQVPFEGKPLPDGSNIGIIYSEEDGTHKFNGSRELRSTYELYRRWLEYLYLEVLLSLEVLRSRRTNAITVNVVDDELITKTLTRDFFEDVGKITAAEQDRVSDLDKFTQFDSDEGLNWIFLWRRSVINQLHDMMAAAKWANDTRKDEELDAMIEVFGDFSYINQVLVSVLYKEESFENRLHILHVEDEHIFKRIRLVATENCAVVGQNTILRLNEKYYGTVIIHTRAFQRCLRNLFSFRQLRDWGYGRPWYKLHLVFYTEVKPQFKNAVEKVRELVTSSRRAKDLFGVVPVERSSLEDNCMICLEDWGDQDLAMETHCHHYFHAACLIRYWDQENHFNFRCPLCRTSGGRIRDRVEFAVNREDFGTDATQEAAQEWTLGEARRLVRENPGIRPEQLPREYQLAIGRQIEAERLRRAFELQASGRGILPLP